MAWRQSELTSSGAGSDVGRQLATTTRSREGTALLLFLTSNRTQIDYLFQHSIRNRNKRFCANDGACSCKIWAFFAQNLLVSDLNLAPDPFRRKPNNCEHHVRELELGGATQTSGTAPSAHLRLQTIMFYRVGQLKCVCSFYLFKAEPARLPRKCYDPLELEARGNQELFLCLYLKEVVASSSTSPGWAGVDDDAFSREILGL